MFVTGTDPVRDGLVASLNRPGGNATGVSFLSSALATKRLELLRQLVPKAAAIAVLVDPSWGTPQAERERRDVQAAADAIGQELIVVEAGSDRDIELSVGLVRCSSVLAGSSTHVGNGWSRWRLVMRYLQVTSSASLPRRVA